MKTLLWVLAWIGVALWSLLAWAGHALIGFAGDLFASNADVAPLSPEGVVGLSGLIEGLAGLGQGAVFVVWAIGSLLILAVPFVADRFFLRRRAPSVVVMPPAGHGMSSAPRPRARLNDVMRAIAQRDPRR